jgi:hypothetical protein
VSGGGEEEEAVEERVEEEVRVRERAGSGGVQVLLAGTEEAVRGGSARLPLSGIHLRIPLGVHIAGHIRARRRDAVDDGAGLDVLLSCTSDGSPQPA